jgi:recombination protein RecR
LEIIIKSSLKIFFNLISTLEELPSIGNKSAIRLAYHIAMENKPLGLKIANIIEQGVRNLRECCICNAISESDICDICIDEQRDNSVLCVVENSNDLFYIEESKIFNGKYFVLGETIAKKEFLKLDKIVSNNIDEVLFALSPSASNDSVILLLEDRLKNFDVKFTKIARGIPTGISIQNVDTLSLIGSFKSRVNV